MDGVMEVLDAPQTREYQDTHQEQQDNGTQDNIGEDRRTVAREGRLHRLGGGDSIIHSIISLWTFAG